MRSTGRGVNKHDPPSTVTKSPVPEGDVEPVDPTPLRFRSTRIALVIQGLLLAALGIWGLVAALVGSPDRPSGVPVLIFHFTVGHASLILATSVLSFVATRSHRLVLWWAIVQTVGYALLFMVTAGGHENWLTDAGDDVLHGLLAAIGLALLLWAADRALNDVAWRRRRRAKRSA